MEDPEDETLDALDEYFDSQADDVTLDAPESQNSNSADGGVRHHLQVCPKTA